jgi:hypothetical protein
MKTPLTLISLVFCLIWSGHASVATIKPVALQKAPESAFVAVRLLKAPGLNLPGSKWEISYEFRIIPESSLWSERAKLKEGSTDRAGDLIKQATIAKSLRSPAGQNVILDIPFTSAVLTKLKNQPKDRRAPGADATSQIFLFYAVINVRDAKLKKTLTIPVTRVWDYANFPDALFEVNVEINNDESFSVKSSSIGAPGVKVQRRTR